PCSAACGVARFRVPETTTDDNSRSGGVDILHMHGPPPRQDSHEIIAQAEASIIRPARKPEIGSSVNAALRERADGLHRVLKRGTRLDLDDGHKVSPLGDQGDLSERRAETTSHDAIALQHERERGKPLTAIPLPICGAPAPDR